MRLVADLRVQVADFTLDLQLEASGPVALVGPNGAGKTTALRTLLGVVPGAEGRLALDGRELLGVPTEARRIGYVPQDGGLFPHLSVARNVAFGLPKGERGRLEQILDNFGLTALASRRPGRLSGGERQRVALARALAPGPAALLLDEPLAALDVDARVEVRDRLGAQLTALDIPCVVVSHDPSDVAALASQVVALEGGRVVQSGPVAAVASQPKTRFVRAFFGMRP